MLTSLFNLCLAYENYSSDTGFMRGMHNVFCWILLMMRDVSEGEVIYDEVNSFYVVLYVMERLNWDSIYASELKG